jgi:tetratricopeptide (TPR) repeat protein
MGENTAKKRRLQFFSSVLLSLKNIAMIDTPPWRTFSIFISSTFSDMQAERDHLKNIVFPRVEEELRKKRIRLETVDLRWGVDTTSVDEDEREATILKVCIEEIERCKPFFIGLLGDRYGWVPPEEKIDNATLGRKLLLPNKGKSVTALEIEFGVLAGKEQLNRSVFYLRKPLPYDKLSPDKAAKYSDQFDPALTPEEQRKRKEALDNLKQQIKSHFNSINLPEKVKPYTANLNYGSGAVVNGLEPWGEVVYQDILSECEKHAEDTWGEAPKDQHEQEVALLEAFIEEHTHITTTITEKGEEQVHTFCGRMKLIEELREHLLSESKETWGIVLTGESGSGKSAVFSMMYKTMIKEECLVLAHSAGISPSARRVTKLLRKWNRQLREYLGIEEEYDEKETQEGEKRKKGPGAIEITGESIKWISEQQQLTGDVQKDAANREIEKLQEKFTELLWNASQKKRIVLLIDALDRFEPTSRAEYMTWLPELLPTKVKVLITAITGTEKNAVQYHKGIITRSIDHFTIEEAREMLYSLGRRQHKSLPKVIEKEILEKEREDGLNASSSPLWLSLAVNILTAMDTDDFEKMSRLEGMGDQQIENYMLEMVKHFPALPGDLFLDLIERAGRIFGGSFTDALFNFIACSRGGLRESDLEVLLTKQTSESWDPLRFAGLRRWFRVHLVEQGEGHQWNLTHSLLRHAIRTIMSPEDINHVHFLIIIHLFTLPKTDALSVTEIMFHFLQINEKKWAIEYYTLDLEDNELTEATNLLSELASSDENGCLTVASFPNLVIDNRPVFIKLLKRYIFDLNNRLREEGNFNQQLAILKEVYGTLEKCSGNYSNCLGYDKVVLLNELGYAYENIGKLEEALNFLFKGLEMSREFYEIDPNNEIIRETRAISLRSVGTIYQKLGLFQKALMYYKESAVLEKEILESSPHNEWSKINLARSYDRIGYILQLISQFEEALTYYLKYQQIAEELYKANPQNELMAEETVICYGRLGGIYQRIGKMKESLFYLKRCSMLGKEILNAKPFKFSAKYNLATSYELLGSAYEVIGQIEDAFSYFIMNKELLKELYNDNPLHESLKYRLAISYERIGSIFQEQGLIEEALSNFQSSAVLFEELYKVNPLNESHKFGVATIFEKFGNINRIGSHLEEALDDFLNAAKLFKELYESNPENIIALERQGISYYKLAMIYKEMGNDDKGREYFSQWKNIISHLAENLPKVPKYAEWNNIQY